MRQRIRQWWDGLSFNTQDFLTYGTRVIGALVLIFVALVAITGRMVASAEGAHETDIAQCMRAFDYTRDQCEFIIKHRIMVLPR